MFGFFKKTTVAVSFVDVTSGREFGVSEVPVAQLPDTFAIDTRMEILGQTYTVVSANPVTKAEFSKSKRLSLRLSPVQVRMADPKDLLFSLPSICGSVPPLGQPAHASVKTHQLHEDDWRQCEYVSSHYGPLVTAELADIRRVRNETAVGIGWSEIHVRERIPVPLLPGRRWSEVLERLPKFDAIDGVSFVKGMIVKGSKAVFLPNGVLLWGVETEVGLEVLSVEHRERASADTQGVLKRLSDDLGLILVDWCQCEAYAPAGTSLAGAAGLAWKVPN